MARALHRARRKMKSTSQKLAGASAILAMLSLGLMVWAMLAPAPMDLLLGAAQAVATLSLALYGWAVVGDLRRARAAAGQPRQGG